MPNIEQVGERNGESVGSNSTSEWDKLSEVEFAGNVRSKETQAESPPKAEPAPVDQLEKVEDNTESENLLGAKILLKTGFHSSANAKEIVDSSYLKARSGDERMPTSNPSLNRNWAYIERLERLHAKFAGKNEQRIWEMSNERLIVKPEDISEKFWEKQQQIRRDNGIARPITPKEKSLIIEDAQKRQRDSLKPWSSYLGDADCPLPMWFKLYAWDGISKMGAFNAEKQTFNKRTEGAIAPFPKLNPAALAKTYEAVTSQDKNALDQNKDEAEKLKALVASGNFNKLYSHFMLSDSRQVQVPQLAEDVHGDWVTYLPGEEEQLANAAMGTPWCVASPSMGKHYLQNDAKNNQAKFFLLHLKTPEGGLDESACASIRLDEDGRVAEISGLKEGQALDDALVPHVEEKVRTLPGGEEFLGAFADKKVLIALDRKMQAGQPLSKEEMEFIYETNREIRQLDTYLDKDPRVEEIRQKYGVQYALDLGIPVNDLLKNMSGQQKMDNLELLVSLDGKINPNGFRTELIINNMERLQACGFNISYQDLADRMELASLLQYANTLREHGAVPNIEGVIKEHIDDNDFFTLTDAAELFGSERGLGIYSPEYRQLLQVIADNKKKILTTNLASLVGNFKEAGVDIGLKPEELVKKWRKEVANGGRGSVQHILPKAEIKFQLEVMEKNGINIDANNLAEYWMRHNPKVLNECADLLTARGAQIDVAKLQKKLKKRKWAE